ncbi:MAG TPA: PDZ domain-containing protein [Candidatus Dormibacteraeota bacterium]|nr:PDZ domain-containing protein [Candidatus Dormibacteraeota bacterium]
MTGTNAEQTKVVDDLIELERRMEAAAKTAASASASAMPPHSASLLADLETTCQRQRDELELQRRRIAPGALSTELPFTRALGRVYAVLSEAAFAYAVLHAMAHRDFDSQAEGNTADLAESHLRAYANAIQQLNLLVSDITVNELGSAHADCRCQCPACGLGLCLCAPHGAITVRQVMQEAIPEPPVGGLRVRRPRAGSEAERAGLTDGDRVLAIDGKDIASDLDAAAVQAAIRAHSSGETVRLKVDRAEGQIELTAHRP